MVNILRCASCQTAVLMPQADGTMICPQCGAVYVVTGRTCPVCESANPPETERCRSCGHTFDLVAHVLETRLISPTEHRQQTKQQVAALKREAEQASEERMRQMWSQEEERRRAVAEAKAKQQQRDRQFVIIIAVVAVVILLALAIYVVVTMI